MICNISHMLWPMSSNSLLAEINGCVMYSWGLRYIHLIGWLCMVYLYSFETQSRSKGGDGTGYLFCLLCEWWITHKVLWLYVRTWSQVISPESFYTNSAPWQLDLASNMTICDLIERFLPQIEFRNCLENMWNWSQKSAWLGSNLHLWCLVARHGVCIQHIYHHG